MRKTLTALTAAATLAIAAVATTTTADARFGGWRGPGIIGGLAAGAIIGGALAAPYYYGGYGPGYYGGYGPGYYGYGPGPSYPCWRRSWNGYRWMRYRAC
jgi:hypothetical protein